MNVIEIEELEQSWRDRVPGWDPYSPRKFIVLLMLCIGFVPGDNRRFLDVGCGIGTKGMLAQRYGLDASGIDCSLEFVAESNRIGVRADLAIAQEYERYGEFGLVYINHPMNHEDDSELELERQIHEAMAPGSVLMAVNYDLAPGCQNPLGDSNPYQEPPFWNEVARIGRWDAAWVKPS